MSRTYNTIRNSFWGLIYKAITLIAPFIIRTIIIKELGIEYLGLSSLFTSILQVLSLTELGFSSAIVFSMYKPISEKNHKKIRALMNFYKNAYRNIGLIILVIGIGVIPFLNKLISGGYPETINIYFLYILYLSNTVISYFLYAYKIALLNANQRQDIISNVLSIVTLIQYVMQVLVLVVYKNYYVYYIFTPIISIIYNLIIARITNKKYPEYYSEGKLEKEDKEDIKKRVTGLMIGKICGTTRNTFDSIIISSFLGLSMVAIYQNYYYIMSNIAGVLTVFITAMSASVGNSVASESIDKNYRDFNRMTFLYAWISGWCTVCLLCLYQTFMKIWVGESLMFSNNIVIILAIYFFVLTSGDIRSVYMNAKGLWWENRYRTILESLSNLILNIILVRFFGISGVILATVISLVLFNFFMSSNVLFAHYFIKKKKSKYFLSYLKYTLVTLLACFITYIITNIVNFTEYEIINLIVKLIICIIVPNLIFILIYKNDENYKESKTMVVNLFNKILKR